VVLGSMCLNWRLYWCDSLSGAIEHSEYIPLVRRVSRGESHPRENFQHSSWMVHCKGPDLVGWKMRSSEILGCEPKNDLVNVGR
jgi:hypothetical protein